ncbi:MAG TPA: CaiB/BaiF CoA-transferase family protein [Acidimicrobiia bacterium]|nr:CaiB/BaiF CoA-transferase family protein [Acidimicrobiia bacterium]
MAGPLTGIRVLELPNIGPMQFAGMVLSDLGAEVLRLDRATSVAAGESIMPASPYASLDRGRRSVGVDLKHPEGPPTVLHLCEHADVLIEGFRPGVAERLGIGPDDCRAANPRLVYGRMTGWGQDGPLAHDPGHDINYIALAGVLAHIGSAGGPPVPPLNLIGDFGGGGLLLAFGILAALVERGVSGEGQVVDAAMVDGSASLMSLFVGLDAMGYWSEERGTNLLDGGAHFYGAYETADDRWISIASYEPQFYAELVRVLTPLGFADLDPATQMDKTTWPGLKERFVTLFRTRTRDEWVELFSGYEVCFAPVLTMREARAHPHNVARETFIEIDGAPQAAPAPRFSRTSPSTPTAPVVPGHDTDSALADWGIDAAEVARLKESGALA